MHARTPAPFHPISSLRAFGSGELKHHNFELLEFAHLELYIRYPQYKLHKLCSDNSKYHIKTNIRINSFLLVAIFFHLLITFANSLDPDQDLQNVGPYLDPNHLTG